MARLDVVELAPGEDDAPASRTVRTPCPVCRQPRVLKVCEPCGVDVDTGELVRPPALPGPPAARAARERRSEVLPPPWTWRDLVRSLRTGLFGGVVLFWLIFSLQVGTAAVVGLGRGSPDQPGGAAIPAQLVTLFFVAYALVARARGVLAGSKPYALEDLGPSILRAVLLLALLVPSFLGPGVALALALVMPVLIGAAASERPLGDLTPAALGRAVRRSEGLLRAMIASVALLGPSLVLVLTPGSPLAIWRPALLVITVTVVGTAAGLARRAAEAHRA